VIKDKGFQGAAKNPSAAIGPFVKPADKK